MIECGRNKMYHEISVQTYSSVSVLLNQYFKGKDSLTGGEMEVRSGSPERRCIKPMPSGAAATCLEPDLQSQVCPSLVGVKRNSEEACWCSVMWCCVVLCCAVLFCVVLCSAVFSHGQLLGQVIQSSEVPPGGKWAVAVQMC